MPDGDIAGFAEVAIRKYANGCDTRPVAFLEGIWVKPELRRRGIGASLIGHVETFLVSQGFRELGSDTTLMTLHPKALISHGDSRKQKELYIFERS